MQRFFVKGFNERSTYHSGCWLVSSRRNRCAKSAHLCHCPAKDHTRSGLISFKFSSRLSAMQCSEYSDDAEAFGLFVVFTGWYLYSSAEHLCSYSKRQRENASNDYYFSTCPPPCTPFKRSHWQRFFWTQLLTAVNDILDYWYIYIYIKRVTPADLSVCCHLRGQPELRYRVFSSTFRSAAASD